MYFATHASLLNVGLHLAVTAAKIKNKKEAKDARKAPEFPLHTQTRNVEIRTNMPEKKWYATNKQYCYCHFNATKLNMYAISSFVHFWSSKYANDEGVSCIMLD